MAVSFFTAATNQLDNTNIEELENGTQIFMIVTIDMIF